MKIPWLDFHRICIKPIYPFWNIDIFSMLSLVIHKHGCGSHSNPQNLCIFQVKFPFSFAVSLLIVCIFLLRYFPLVSSMLLVAYWSIFVIAALKSPSDNSNIYVVSSLVSWLPFFIQFDIFLVLGMTSDFQVKPEHFWVLCYKTDFYLSLLF